MCIADLDAKANNLFMDEITERADRKLKERGQKWAHVAKALETSDQTVYNWRKRGIPKHAIAKIADFLGCTTDWLLTGKTPASTPIQEVTRIQAAELREPGDEHLTDDQVCHKYEQLAWQAEPGGRSYQTSGPRQPIKGSNGDELEFFGHMDAWDSKTPLDEDEVELPLFREIELAAGAGATQVIENQGAKLRFAKSTLRRAGVPVEAAACAFVRGNSMEPVMPDGTCVGVNTADKAIKDGEIYAIDHGGMLRVKYLHRRPGGGVKIVSQNAGEHPVEEVTADDMAAGVRVIGRVFWWSVLR